MAVWKKTPFLTKPDMNKWHCVNLWICFILLTDHEDVSKQKAEFWFLLDWYSLGMTTEEMFDRGNQYFNIIFNLDMKGFIK